MIKMKFVFSKPFSYLLLTLFSSEVGSTIITPLLPFLFFSSDVSFFDVNASHAFRAIWYGYASAALRIGAFLASVLLGLAMDYWGRRWVLFLSCFGLAVSMGVLALSIDQGAFLLFIGGLFFCKLLYAGKQTAQAMVGDEKSSHSKLLRMSLLQSGIALGACLGPFGAGFLSHAFKSFSFPFWIAAVFALFASLVVLMGISETITKNVVITRSQKKVMRQSFFKILSSRAIQRLLLQLLLSQLSWGSYYEFSPLFAKLNFDFTPEMTGFFVGMIALCLILGSALILPALSTRFSTFSMKCLSAVLMLVGTFMICVTPYQSLFWLSMGFVAVGDVMIYTLIVNELSDAVPSAYQGRITGLVYVVITLSWSFTGVLGGYLTAYANSGALWFSTLGALGLSGYFLTQGILKLGSRK